MAALDKLHFYVTVRWIGAPPETYLITPVGRDVLTVDVEVDNNRWVVNLKDGSGYTLNTVDIGDIADVGGVTTTVRPSGHAVHGVQIMTLPPGP